MKNKTKKRFFRLATKVALRSGCLRAKRGAVLVKNGKVLVVAYNRVYPQNDFCQKHGCLRDKLKLGLGQSLEKCRSIHAEALAICRAAKKGVSLKGAVAFLTCLPCINCAKLLLAAGVKKVFFLDLYGDKTGKVFLEKMGVPCRRVKLSGDLVGLRLRDVTGQ